MKTPMNIHLAASYDRRWSMLSVASALERAGHHVTSRWIQGGRGDDPPIIPAVEDLIDLARADCLVTFTDVAGRDATDAPAGEHDVAFGVALALGKRLCLVGPRETIFHHLQSVEAYESVADLVAALNVFGPAR
jgi:hypothetical protein